MKPQAPGSSPEEKSRTRDEVIQRVFQKNYSTGAAEVPFTMDDIRDAIAAVASMRPGYKENNVADVRYEYSSGRKPLPELVNKLGGPLSDVPCGRRRCGSRKLSAGWRELAAIVDQRRKIAVAARCDLLALPRLSWGGGEFLAHDASRRDPVRTALPPCRLAKGPQSPDGRAEYRARQDRAGSEKEKGQANRG